MRRVGKTKEELSLKDVLKVVNDHSGIIRQAIAMEEEARTAVRIRMDDHESNLRKLAGSTGGLHQFTEDMTQLMEKLNNRLARIEASLQKPAGAIREGRSQRIFEEDSDPSTPSQSPFPTNHRSRSDTEDTEKSSPPVRVLTRSLSAASGIAALVEEEGGLPVMRVPKVPSRTLVPDQTKVTTALTGDSSDDEDKRTGSEEISPDFGVPPSASVVVGSVSDGKNPLSPPGQVSEGLFMTDRSPLLDSEDEESCISATDDSRRPFSSKLDINSIDMFSDDDSESSRVGSVIAKSPSSAFLSATPRSPGGTGGAAGVVVTEQFDFSPAPKMEESEGSAAPGKIDDRDDPDGNVESTVHQQDGGLITADVVSEGIGNQVRSVGNTGARPVFLIEYAESSSSIPSVGEYNTTSPVTRLATTVLTSNSRASDEDQDGQDVSESEKDDNVSRQSFESESPDDATSITEGSPGYLRHAYSTDLSGRSSRLDRADSVPEDFSVDRSDEANTDTPRPDAGEIVVEHAAPVRRRYPDLDVDDGLMEVEGVGDGNAPQRHSRPVFTVQYSESSVVLDPLRPISGRSDIMRFYSDDSQRSTDTDAPPGGSGCVVTSDGTMGVVRSEETEGAEAGWASGSDMSGGDSVPPLSDGPDDEGEGEGEGDCREGERSSDVSDLEECMIDVRLAPGVERDSSDSDGDHGNGEHPDELSF
jgi:hypothetical protein